MAAQPPPPTPSTPPDHLSVASSSSVTQSDSIVGGELSATNDSTNVAGRKLGRFRRDPLGFIIRLMAESSAFYSGSGWRGYENYIGARIFYPEYSSEIRSALLRSERLRAVVKAMAQKRLAAKANDAAASKKSGAVVKAKKKRAGDGSNELAEIENEVWKEVGPMIDGMIADMDSIRVIKFVAFMTNNILVRMYHQGIHIHEAEFLELRSWAERAQREKMSLIFLPCHKSHVDYLVISYIFFRLGLALPHIAAGDNLNMPIVGTLLKYSGAFFIRRVWGDDQLYVSVMREYIELLLNRGHNMEAFIEGTRSRIGKLLQPKFGILKIILEAVLAGRTKDCIIVPMSIGYDRVIETESYVSELLGTPKQKESLAQLLGSANILQFKWGRIDVRFAKPFSLREYIDSQIVRRGVGFDPAEVIEHRNLLIQTMGYQVLSDINHISVVMPTALVGTVLLTLRGRGVGRDELIRKVDWLKRTVILKGGTVADFGGNSTGWVVDRAIQVLKDSIGQRNDLLEPVYYPLKRFELCFYRNQVIHLFINEAILSTAMYATVKAGGPVHSQKILIHPNLEIDVSFVSQLLKNEFVYGPGGLRDNLNETVDNMTALDVFSVQEDVGVDGKRWITLSAEERRIGRETFDFYCFLLWPFIETYWLAAISCFALIPKDINQSEPVWVDDRVFNDRAQFLGKTLYYEGDLSYFEAVNKETLKNAFIRLKEMGVIMYRKGPANPGAPSASGKPGKAVNITWVALSLDWYPKCALPSPPPSFFTAQTRKAKDAQKGPSAAAPADLSESAAAAAGASGPAKLAIRHNNHEAITGQVAAAASAPPSAKRHPSRRRVIDDDDEGGAEADESEEDEGVGSSGSGARGGAGTRPSDYFEPWHKHTPDGRLWDLCEQIGRFRREGKNRRDTATVASRVLMLATATRVLVVDQQQELAAAAAAAGRFGWGKKGGAAGAGETSAAAAAADQADAAAPPGAEKKADKGGKGKNAGRPRL
ncbi:acyltransferase-domain-containing protein [Zopfochytrium polystomum]|nr:acyltransferase-domain-containing protein [Zopfochytrium polystomum]